MWSVCKPYKCSCDCFAKFSFKPKEVDVKNLFTKQTFRLFSKHKKLQVKYKIKKLQICLYFELNRSRTCSRSAWPCCSTCTLRWLWTGSRWQRPSLIRFWPPIVAPQWPTLKHIWRKVHSRCFAIYIFFGNDEKIHRAMQMANVKTITVAQFLLYIINLSTTCNMVICSRYHSCLYDLSN